MGRRHIGGDFFNPGDAGEDIRRRDGEGRARGVIDCDGVARAGAAGDGGVHQGSAAEQIGCGEIDEAVIARPADKRVGARAAFN